MTSREARRSGSSSAPGGQGLLVDVQGLAIGAHLLQDHPLVDPGDPDLFRGPGLPSVAAGEGGGLGMEVERRRVASGLQGEGPEVGEIDRLGLGVPRLPVELQGLQEPGLGLSRLPEPLQGHPQVVERLAQGRRVLLGAEPAQGLPAVRESGAVIPQVHLEGAGVVERRGRRRRVAARRHHGVVLPERLRQMAGGVEPDGLVDRGGRRQQQRQGQGRERNPGRHGAL